MSIDTSSIFRASEDDPDSKRADYPMPDVISRDDFLQKFKEDYGDGQHLTAMGPTQRGKSHLIKSMLNEVISPDRKMTVLIGKPPGRERTWDDEAAQKLNLRIVRTWKEANVKPKNWKRDKDRNGFMLRPDQSLTDIEADERHLATEFRKAILGNYSDTKHKTITVVDEGHHVQVDFGLKKVCEAPLMRGAPDNSMWTLLQRSRFVSYLCYDAPEHIIIFRDDDRANQQRYSEIGGIDSRHLSSIVRRLRTERVPSGGTISQALYFRRSGSELHIIDT